MKKNLPDCSTSLLRQSKILIFCFILTAFVPAAICLGQNDDPSSWITIDSVNFSMQYPLDWDMQIDSSQKRAGFVQFTFSPKKMPDALFNVTLSITDMSPIFKNYDKDRLRSYELKLIRDGITNFIQNAAPDPIVDSTINQSLYKDFKVEKHLYENKDAKGESDIYTGNGTFAIGYMIKPKSIFYDYRKTIETMLNSFKLKSGGITIVEIAKGKQATTSQSNIVKPVHTYNPYRDKIFDSADVQVEPRFSGDWQKFLRDSLRTDFLQEKNVPKGKYAVTISFVVDYNGSISEVKALNNPGYGTAQEAVRVIQSAKFRSAMQNGGGVSCRIKRTITFEAE